MSKKILIVIDNLESGGAQRQASLLAADLIQKGYSVEFFVYFKGNFYANVINRNKIKVHFYEKKDKVGLYVITGLIKVLKTNNFEIALSFLDTPNFYLSIAKLFSGTKTKIVISERTMTKEHFFSFKVIIKKISHYLADFCTTNSYHEKNRLIERKISKKGKIVTIYNGVDLDKFKPNSGTKKRVNEYLSVASVSPFKNGMVLIEAMNLLKNDGMLNFKVKWFGQKVYTIKSRADYISKMEKAIQDYGLNEHWEWIEPAKDIEQEYLKFDALIHTSFEEGLPNVVCEALACGLPIIISNVLDHPILADFGKNGFLFDYRSPISLKNAIISFESKTDIEYNAICEHSRDFALKTFNFKTFTEKYIEIFQTI